ncbi:hypothetical protein phiV208_41 [Vibrio phage phiV208]|nr:hypothetical protein phiV208_41 [Vibrio phage phiV208]
MTKKKELKKPVSVSMTESEKKQLSEKAKKSGRTLSNYLLWVAINA